MIPTTFIDLTSDFGFKKLFGEEPNKELLRSFLNEVFQGKKIYVIDRTDPYSMKD